MKLINFQQTTGNGFNDTRQVMPLFKMIVVSLVVLTVAGRADCFASTDRSQFSDDRIYGTVVTADGQPAINADVVLGHREQYGNAPLKFTKTDKDGYFEFPGALPEYVPFELSVYQKGSALTHYFRNPEQPQHAMPVNIQLNKARPVTLHIRRPDGGPLKSGTIACKDIGFFLSMSIGNGDAFKLLPGCTVTNGKATLDWMDEYTYAEFEIQTEEFGNQRFRLDGLSDRVTIRMQPLCTLRGKVIDAGNFGSFENVKLDVYSRTQYKQTSSIERDTFSRLTIDVNPDGTFESNQLTAGLVAIEHPRSATTRYYFPESISQNVYGNPTVTPDAPLSLDLTLKRKILVTGSVVDLRGSPLSKTTVTLMGGVITNKNGEYSAYCPPGHHFASVIRAPAPYLRSTNPNSRITVPDDVVEFEVEPIRLKKAVPISGRVVDEQGNPVPDATVYSRWSERHDESVYPRGDSCRSDAEGNFVLKQTDGDHSAELYALAGEQAFKEKVTVVAGADRDVVLKVFKSERLSAKGQVVDENGEPVRRARIEMYQGSDLSGSQKLFEGKRFILTDENGKFETPICLNRFNDHSVRVHAIGYKSLVTEYRVPPDSDQWDVGKLVINRIAEIRGIVQDMSGNPVQGAKVWSYQVASAVSRNERVATVTDEQGNFVLSNISPDAPFYFIEHPEYRFTGSRMPKLDEAQLIKLAGINQLSNERPLIMRNLPVEEQYGLQSELMQLVAPEQPDRKTDNWFGAMLGQLAQTQPDLAAKYIPKISTQRAKVRVLFAIGEFSEGLALIRSTGDEYAYNSLIGFTKLPNLSVEQKRQMLREASSMLNSASSPDSLITGAAKLIMAYRSLGEMDAANRLISKYKDRATNTELSDLAMMRFAAALAPIDPDAALKILDAVDDTESRRIARYDVLEQSAYGGFECVRKVVSSFEEPIEAARVLPGACLQLAKLDPNKTITFVDEFVDNNWPMYKAACYRCIIEQISESNPVRARQLLREAFHLLEDPRNQSIHLPVRLLMLAEKIDPESMSEYWWQVIVCCGGPANRMTIFEPLEIGEQERQKDIAVMLAAFDRFPELQSEIIESMFEFWESTPIVKDQAVLQIGESFAAMAIYDPQRAIKLVRQWRQEGAPNLIRQRVIPCRQIIHIITADNQTFKDTLTFQIYGPLIGDPQYD